MFNLTLMNIILEMEIKHMCKCYRTGALTAIFIKKCRPWSRYNLVTFPDYIKLSQIMNISESNSVFIYTTKGTGTD